MFLVHSQRRIYFMSVWVASFFVPFWILFIVLPWSLFASRDDTHSTRERREWKIYVSWRVYWFGCFFFHRFVFVVYVYNAWPRKNCDSRHAYAFSVKKKPSQTYFHKNKRRVRENKKTADTHTQLKRENQNEQHNQQQQQQKEPTVYESLHTRKCKNAVYKCMNLKRARDNFRVVFGVRTTWMIIQNKAIQSPSINIFVLINWSKKNETENTLNFN